MGKGSKAPSGPQEVVQTTSNLPEYAKPYFTEMLGRTMYETTRPYETFPGQRLQDFSDFEKLLEDSIGDVFILKPMLIGNIKKLQKMSQLLSNEEKRYNISSLLESNIGRLAYLHLASALNIEEECGIATNVFFENDLCSFPKTSNGIISIDNKFGLGLDEINI